MWDEVLAHREPEERPRVVERFTASGVSADTVAAVLADAGDDLYRAARQAAPDWPQCFGGAIAVALLAAEVSALAAHLNSRASAVRGRVVDDLLDDVSAVAVADHLGVSRQQVYTIARRALDRPYIDQAPWRRT